MELLLYEVASTKATCITLLSNFLVLNLRMWNKIPRFVATFSSVQFSHSVVSSSLRPHESQHTRPPCPSPTPGVYSNSCPSSRWCHPVIPSFVIPFSSCPQSLSASGSFPMSQLFAWGGQSIGVSASASVLPMNTQDWSPLGWTGWISLLRKDYILRFEVYQAFPDSSIGKQSVCNAEEPSSISGLGRSHGEGIGYPLQYSWTSLVTQLVKNPPAMRGDLGSIPGLGGPPREGKIYPSSILT